MPTPAAPNSISVKNVETTLNEGLSTNYPSGTSKLTFNDGLVRTLAARPSGSVSMNDMRGKAGPIPSGTVIGTPTCSGSTLTTVIADGRYGTTTITTPNSPICGWTGTQPSSLLRQPTNRLSVCVSVALSGDGNTMAAGFNDPAGTSNVGVLIYTRSNSNWVLQATLLPSPNTTGQFGYSIGLSYTGDYCVVGDPTVDTMYQSGSGSAGPGQSYTYSRTVPLGAVYVFARTGTSWAQQAKIRPTNYIWNRFDSTDFKFGISVAINTDGTLISFGSPGDNNAKNPYSYNNQGWSSYGAIYIYTRSGTTWTQSQKIAGDTFGSYEVFGTYLAMTPDGNTLVSTTGVQDGYQSAPWSRGAKIKIFNRTGGTFTLKQTIDSDSSDYVTWNQYEISTFSLTSIAISSDGLTIAVGSSNYDSNLLPGALAYQVGNHRGRTKIYVYNGTTWSLQTYLSQGVDIAGEGNSVSLSSDGNKLLVGASSYGANYDYYNQIGYSGIYEAEGAAYLYSRTGATWSLVRRIDPPAGSVASTDAGVDQYYSYGGAYHAITFGYSVAISTNAMITAFALETESDRGSVWTLM